MAVIIWRAETRPMLKEHFRYAKNEFGQATVRKWKYQLDVILERLQKYPESFTPVEELQDMPILFRGCIVMHNFKLIYYYEEQTDKVVIVTIWDMRRNPQALIREMKSMC